MGYEFVILSFVSSQGDIMRGSRGRPMLFPTKREVTTWVVRDATTEGVPARDVQYFFGEYFVPRAPMEGLGGVCTKGT